LIKEVFESISEKMQSDFEKVTKLLSHPGVKGTARENALMHYLRPHIPDKFEFSEGIIIDSFDHQSRQVDVIIHDRIATPFLQDRDLANVIPIESVYAVIEVKSTLTKDELTKCVENIKSVRSLKKNTITGQISPTLGFVFAYDADSTLETIYKNFLEQSNHLTPEQQITCICVLNKGLILPIHKARLSSITLLPSTDTLFAMHNNASNALLMFYLLLFQGLNSITVYPPNMMAYANSDGRLDTQLIVPPENLPDTVLFPFMDKSISIAEIKSMQELGDKILSGELTEDEYLETVFSLYIPMIIKSHGSLDKAIGHGELNYFGCVISYEELIRMYYIYRKGESATEHESKELSRFKEKMYNLYNEHREEMRKNYKANKTLE